MEKLLEFLNEYKDLLVSVIVFILGVVTLCVKRKPASVDEVLSILHEVGSSVPCYVSAVEEPGNGNVKKEKVISMCFSQVSKKLHRPLSDQEKVEMGNYFGLLIESVLETPQKKGVNQ